MQTKSKYHLLIRRAGLALCKRMPALRKLRYVYWGRQRRRYDSLTRRTQTEERVVIFEAFGGRQYACSPRAIYEAMCADARFDNWTFYWSFKGGIVERMREVPELSRAQLLVRGSKEYFDAFARAAYWVQNNRVAEYVYPKVDQTYVQCWHGTPLKRLGFDVPETTQGGALNSARELANRFALDSEKWTYLLSPSEYTSACLCSAFGVDGSRRSQVVLELGYPRNDSIVRTLGAPDADQQITDMKVRLGIPTDKKVLLYAPTWRDDQYTEGVGYTQFLPLDLDVLRDGLGDGWVVLLRMHYYIANKIDLTPWQEFAFDVSSAVDINDLYCISDVLCTDYSSVFFDFANTGRPFVFYWPDLKHYEQDLHGFYLDVKSLPGQKATDTKELVYAVKEAFDLIEHPDQHAADIHAYQEFRTTYCSHDDGYAASRVVERVFCKQGLQKASVATESKSYQCIEQVI